MAEKAEFLRLMSYWRESSVLLVTFALTLIVDLTTGILAGCALAALYAVLKRAVHAEGD